MNNKSLDDIRPAATLALVRDTPNGLEVLLLQRTWSAVFLPGYYVFPGGAVDQYDSHGRNHAAGPGDTEISHTMSLSEGGTDYMLAAVRECFEEAGVLLAMNSDKRIIDADHAAYNDREAVFRGEVSLADLCQRHQLTIPLDHIAYLSHWITPPGPPRRFDTRFFVTKMPEGQPVQHDGDETINHLWISPAKALEELNAGELLMTLPTIRTLRVLRDFDTADELMRYAWANPPEPFPSQPWPATRRGKPVILEPGAPSYDEAVKLDPEAEGTTLSEIIPGEPVEVAAGVIRLTAPNPSVMTGPGTNTYILGHERFTVLDPGPDHAGHIGKILELTGGKIDSVVVTHTHLDHSPGTRPLQEKTGCRVYGLAPPAGASQDQLFAPDEQPEHGDLIKTDAGMLKALHTPGHASNHLCFLLVEQELLFSGDHIMQGSTVVINPPDGDMKAYIESLYELLEEPVRFIAPAHGFLMARPEAIIDYLITHRLTREHKVAKALDKLSPVNLKDLTRRAYGDVPAAIHSVAARSALAHLLKLEADGRALQDGELWQATETT